MKDSGIGMLQDHSLCEEEAAFFLSEFETPATDMIAKRYWRIAARYLAHLVTPEEKRALFDNPDARTGLTSGNAPPLMSSK